MIKVLAVHGVSYCGSTLLNMMLGAHPEIYGGGELNWHIADDGFIAEQDLDQKHCRICGKMCSVWTEDALKYVKGEDFFYEKVAEVSGKDIIVDIGKSALWFSRSQNFKTKKDVKFYRIIMTKHPVRHITSLIVNRGFGWVLQGDNVYMKTALFSGAIQNRLVEEYVESAEFFPTDTEHRGLKYEDLVTQPERCMQEILKYLEIDYHSSVLDPFKHEQHFIGGNTGAASVMTIQHDKHIAKKGKIMEEWYAGRSIRLDNKYVHFLTKEDVDWIQGIKQVQDLCGILGYEPLTV